MVIIGLPTLSGKWPRLKAALVMKFVDIDKLCLGVSAFLGFRMSVFCFIHNLSTFRYSFVQCCYVCVLPSKFASVWLILLHFVAC